MNEYNVINSPKIKGSDWNAKEGESGYIKNRTHYENVTEESVGTTVTIPSEWETPTGMPEYWYIPTDISAYTNFIQDLMDYLLSDSEKVENLPGKIKINNIEHDCYWYAKNESVDGIKVVQIVCAASYNSNQNMYFGFSKFDEEQQIIFGTNHIPIGENSIEIPILKTEVKKLDPKYLPEMKSLSNIKDAENGGIIEGLVNGETGQVNVANGLNAHAEGGVTSEDPDTGITYVINQATGDASHAEGSGTTASGQRSHSEGTGTTASGMSSHSEGIGATASGMSSHAEGSGTRAFGQYSHAEGAGTGAFSQYSHAEGNTTVANHAAQHVFGEYNVEDPSTAEANERGTYVEIVGNGNSGNHSNARTLDWSGNEWISGNLTINGTPTDDNHAVTKAYVDAHSGGASSAEYYCAVLSASAWRKTPLGWYENNKISSIFDPEGYFYTAYGNEYNYFDINIKINDGVAYFFAKEAITQDITVYVKKEVLNYTMLPD